MKKVLIYSFVMITLIITLITLGTAHAEPILYGIAVDGNPGGSSTLYTIDPATGTATPVGQINGFVRVRGMDFGPDGMLYATGERASDNTHVLMTIDPKTAAATEVGPTGVETLDVDNDTLVPDVFAAAELSFRTADGTLFALLAAFDALGTINIQNGTAALTGGTGFVGNGNGMAFTFNDTLYHTSGTALNTVNQSTGVSTFLRNLVIPPPADNFPRINTMDAHPETGVLYASVNDGLPGNRENHLATVDPATGAVTIIGPTVDGLSDIAFSPPIFDSELPGSVLVFPKFDITGDATDPARLETYVRICDTLEGPKGDDSVYIRYNFVCPGIKFFDPFCRALDIERHLTYKGCVNIKVRDINPPCPQGFVVAYAENANQVPISYNFLIGSSLILQPKPQRAFATQAVAIQSSQDTGTPLGPPQGPLVFDGNFYKTCGRDLFTDFRAVTNNKTSDLTLLTLDSIAGAQNDPTLVDIDFWNKDEDKFSSSFEYVCWAEVPLAIPGANFCDNDPRVPANYCIDPNFLQANLGTNIGQIELNNTFSQPLIGQPVPECVIATIEERERAWMTQRKLYHDNNPVGTIYFPE